MKKSKPKTEFGLFDVSEDIFNYFPSAAFIFFVQIVSSSAWIFVLCPRGTPNAKTTRKTCFQRENAEVYSSGIAGKTF